MPAIPEKPSKSACRWRMSFTMGVSPIDTPATCFLKSLMALLDERDRQTSCRALRQVLAFVTHCSRSNADGVRLPDLAQPGDAFLIFANGDGAGCCCGGNVSLDELDAARESAATLSAVDRRERLLGLTRLARDRTGTMPDDESRVLALEIAGLVAGSVEVEALRDVTSALPAFVVLTRRERGLRSVRWKVLSTTLPGQWLGTCALAGSA